MATVSRRTRVAVVVLASAAAVAVLAWVPPFVGLALTVALAGWWCSWLERHPPA